MPSLALRLKTIRRRTFPRARMVTFARARHTTSDSRWRAGLRHALPSEEEENDPKEKLHGI